MIANKIVDDITRNNKEGVMYKLDMEKTFENVHWDFIDYMFRRMGFGQKWRS